MPASAAACALPRASLTASDSWNFWATCTTFWIMRSKSSVVASSTEAARDSALAAAFSPFSCHTSAACELKASRLSMLASRSALLVPRVVSLSASDCTRRSSMRPSKASRRERNSSRSASSVARSCSMMVSCEDLRSALPRSSRALTSNSATGKPSMPSSNFLAFSRMLLENPFEWMRFSMTHCATVATLRKVNNTESTQERRMVKTVAQAPQ
mmetsp:Transcript_124599/g.265767  ORF Transcript_124599/g.265767 Transcript_124599/m.265767 type:complete len:213 (-) Transcript_124599:1297-1935(-)